MNNDSDLEDDSMEMKSIAKFYMNKRGNEMSKQNKLSVCTDCGGKPRITLTDNFYIACSKCDYGCDRAHSTLKNAEWWWEQSQKTKRRNES